MNRLENIQKLLEESPNDSFLYFALAKEYEKFEDFDNALKFYLELVEKDSDYVGTYYHLAKLYEELEENEKALSIYDDGIVVASKLGENHALKELKQAKMNLEFMM